MIKILFFDFYKIGISKSPKLKPKKTTNQSLVASIELQDFPNKMEELKILRNNYLEGFISEEEYNTKKTQMIDKMTKTTLKKKTSDSSMEDESKGKKTNSSKPSICLSTLSGRTTGSEEGIESPKSIQTTYKTRRSSIKIIKKYKERQSTDLGLDSAQFRELRESNPKKKNFLFN